MITIAIKPLLHNCVRNMISSVMKLTCIAESGGEGRGGLPAAVLRHSAVSLHGERVVKMRIQVTDYDRGVPQVCGARLKSDLLATGHTRGPVAALTHHTVGEVTAAPCHKGRAPGQLQPALCRQSGGGQVTRSTRWGWGKETDSSAVSG